MTIPPLVDIKQNKLSVFIGIPKGSLYLKNSSERSNNHLEQGTVHGGRLPVWSMRDVDDSPMPTRPWQSFRPAMALLTPRTPPAARSTPPGEFAANAAPPQLGYAWYGSAPADECELCMYALIWLQLPRVKARSTGQRSVAVAELLRPGGGSARGSGELPRDEHAMRVLGPTVQALLQPERLLRGTGRDDASWQRVSFTPRQLFLYLETAAFDAGKKGQRLRVDGKVCRWEHPRLLAAWSALLEDPVLVGNMRDLLRMPPSPSPALARPALTARSASPPVGAALPAAGVAGTALETRAGRQRQSLALRRSLMRWRYCMVQTTQDSSRQCRSSVTGASGRDPARGSNSA